MLMIQKLLNLKVLNKITVHITFICMVLALTMFPVPAHSINVIATQNYADDLARKMSKDGPDHKTLKEYLRVCAILKLQSTYDWCTLSNINRRWIGYARSHGFLKEVDQYRKLYDKPAVKKPVRKNLTSQKLILERAEKAEALEKALEKAQEEE